MALATWKSGRMKNAKTKCAHQTKQGKMALLHCLTRDLIFHSWCKFPTATADFTSHNFARAIYFVCFFFHFGWFFSSSVYVDNAGVHWLCPYLRRFRCIRLTASNIVRQQQTQATFSFRLFIVLFAPLFMSLSMFQWLLHVPTYHRLCGGLSSFSDCQILVES